MAGYGLSDGVQHVGIRDGDGEEAGASDGDGDGDGEEAGASNGDGDGDELGDGEGDGLGDPIEEIESFR